MSDFLARLAERQLATAFGVAPRMPSRFAPPLVPQVEPEMPHQAPGHAAAVERVPLPRRPVAVERGDSHHERRTATPPAQAEPSRQASERPAQVAEAARAPGPRPRTSSREHITSPDSRQPRIEIVERTVRVASATEMPSALVASPVAEAALPHAGITTRAPASGSPRLPEPLVPPKPELPAVPRALETDLPAVDRGEPPIVQVTIGRLEVRAAVPPTPARERRAAPARKPLPLEEYLERRHGGGR